MRLSGWPIALLCLTLALTMAWARPSVATAAAEPEKPQRYIVVGASVPAAEEAVQEAGGKVTRELGILKGVGAELTQSQVKSLKTDRSVRHVFPTSKASGD